MSLEEEHTDPALIQQGSSQEDEVVYEPPVVSDALVPAGIHIERPTVGVIKSYCTRSFGVVCERCVQVCPHGALSLPAEDAAPVLDEDKCTRCGLCEGVCDAFANNQIILEDLLAKARSLARDEGKVVFTCAEHVQNIDDPAPCVIVLSCLGQVPPEFWTVLLREGINVVIHADFDFCRTCFDAGEMAEDLYGMAISLAEQWSGQTCEWCDFFPLDTGVWHMLLGEDSSDGRRGMLGSFAAGGVEIATGEYARKSSKATRDHQRKLEHMRAEGHLCSDEGFGLAALRSEPGRNKETRPRQDALVASVQAYPQGAEQIPRWFSVTDEERCNACGACIEVCPSAARQFNVGAVGAENQYATVDFTRCFACGACVGACEQVACSMVEGTARWFLPEDGAGENEAARGETSKNEASSCS